MDIVLGVVGAIVGGYIGNLIGMGPTVSVLSFWNIILAVIGACIVLWVYHMVVARA
ncbi:GlsB/YeaQ/YmgE family stress response membrane protein [Roseiarcus sp.]|uniref:GlsB/YeaQ/YmgE family stress response membrane protein n=1 Tax=Roseiarcus sp. TaxID=1969460 RepID=UPI003D0C1945